MRVSKWQWALREALKAAHGKRFRWGYHDCCQFVGQCVEAITGEDRRDLFSRYKTRKEAEALLAKHGGMQGLLTHAFGDPVHCSRASMGDVVLVDMGMGPQPAVCMGLDSFAPGKRKLEHRKTLTAICAWTI